MRTKKAQVLAFPHPDPRFLFRSARSKGNGRLRCGDKGFFPLRERSYEPGSGTGNTAKSEGSLEWADVRANADYATKMMPPDIVGASADKSSPRAQGRDSRTTMPSRRAYLKAGARRCARSIFGLVFQSARFQTNLSIVVAYLE